MLRIETGNYTLIRSFILKNHREKYMDNKNKRNPLIDIYRGICIFLVVLGHVFLYLAKGSQEKSLFFAFIYCTHMYAFFIISGFLCNIHKEKGLLQQIKEKALRLVIPYFSWSLIGLLANLLVYKKDNKSINFMPLFKDKILGAGTVWFFITLFLCCILHYITTYLCDYFHFKLSILLEILFWIVGTILLPNNFLALWHWKIFGLAFIVGVITKTYLSKIDIPRKIRLPASISAVSIYFLFIFTIYNYNLYIRHRNCKINIEWFMLELIFLFIGICGSYIILLCSYLLHKGNQISNFLIIIGKNSLAIYCIHIIFVHYIKIKLYLLMDNGPIYWVAILTTTFIISIICIIINEFMKKYFTKIWKFLFIGEKI